MKLICENSQNVEYVLESNQDKKNYTIQGVYMESEVQNGNGRVYPKKILESAVNAYQDKYVSAARAVGELDHPEGPKINSDRISHRITDLWWEGNKVYGKALVLPTPCGRIVEGLLDGGCQLGVSSRGVGSISRKNGRSEVGSDFMLRAVDVVQDPSAPTAFVNGIMEGVEWTLDNGVLKPQQIEEWQEEIHSTSSKQLDEAKTRIWKEFLSGLNA